VCLYGKFAQNAFLTYASNSSNTLVGYRDIGNIVGMYNGTNIKSLVSLLHLGAHKSTRFIKEQDLISNKGIITNFLELSHLYFEWKNNEQA